MTPDERQSRRPVYLTGPTASGKTAVGVALARRLDAEVIAMDSMTLYRGMDIGTAKPTTEERAGVPHHVLDVIDPWDAASLADYLGWADAALVAIASRGRRAIFVGGTPLYLKGLLRGLFDGPPGDPALRASIEAEAQQIGPAALHERLAAIDPTTAARLHPNDQRRIIRAIEVFEITGKPLSAHHGEHDRAATGNLVFAIERPRDILRHRIDRRVVAMIEAGLIDEVRRLLDAPRPISAVAAQGVGYRETIAVIEGKASPSELIGQIQAHTRQFAKRQATWFRGLDEVRAWPVGPDEDAEAIADRLARAVR